uniref:Uncharacterized protein n=1 Tax=Arundo donax TaxID=35708 RepID=A0A0A8YJM2_ARUDO
MVDIWNLDLTNYCKVKTVEAIETPSDPGGEPLEINPTSAQIEPKD